MDLVVTDLAVARGGVVVLRGVSFALRAGQALILRGPNGVGKTTLLRTIAGLQPPVSGQIAAPPDSATYAGHADAVKSTLSVAENLRFWASIHGRTDIGPGLRAMDLSTLEDRPAQRLSAGQRRRLGLARLVLSDRPLWLLDEPTVSLDTGSVGLFVAMLKAHLAAGGLAVLATHIDLGLDGAATLDLSPFAAHASTGPGMPGGFDEAFL